MLLDTSVKNTGVVDRSLHISTLLFSFRIYIDDITPFAVEIATDVVGSLWISL